MECANNVKKSMCANSSMFEKKEMSIKQHGNDITVKCQVNGARG